MCVVVNSRPSQKIERQKKPVNIERKLIYNSLKGHDLDIGNSSLLIIHFTDDKRC